MITLGPSLMGLRGTQVTGSIIYTLVRCRTQFKGFMRDHRLDILGLQETIKLDFSTAELCSLECGNPFIWNCVPAEG
jgi:hypothetical protein